MKNIILLVFIIISKLECKKILLIRHGARAPVSFSELEKQLWVDYE